MHAACPDRLFARARGVEVRFAVVCPSDFSVPFQCGGKGGIVSLLHGPVHGGEVALAFVKAAHAVVFVGAGCRSSNPGGSTAP